MAPATVRAPETIPQHVKCDLIALAILQRQFRELRAAIDGRRAEVEAKMPGAVQLASDAGLIGTLIDENNERIAKKARARAVRS